MHPHISVGRRAIARSSLPCAASFGGAGRGSTAASALVSASHVLRVSQYNATSSVNFSTVPQPAVSCCRMCRDGTSSGCACRKPSVLAGARSHPSSSRTSTRRTFSSKAEAAAESTSDAGHAASAESSSKSTDTSNADSAAGSAGSSRMYKIVEDIKDVFAVAFGMERKRDVQKEYDLGIREYPWVCYEDPSQPGSGVMIYRNKETNQSVDIKPADFDQRAKPSAYLVLNDTANAVALIDEEASKSKWQKSFDNIKASPIIQGAVAAGKAVASSPVGQVVGSVADRVKQSTDGIAERWETSQHPLVVNSAHLVDHVLTETEQAKALREMKFLDSGFDEMEFLRFMKEEYLPMIARAFFVYDEPLLKKVCREAALAQCKGAQANREAAGFFRHDGIILDVSKVNLMQAKSMEAGLPVMVLSAQVQYIHTARNKAGEIVDGSESSVKMSTFVVAVTREVDQASGTLEWKTAEIAMQNPQLYL